LIRRLRAADWALLRDVRLRSLADAPAAFGSTHERELGFDEAKWRERAESSAWFVAADADADADADEDGDGALGIVAGYHDPASPAGQRHLLAMWVAPQARGTGLARALVEIVITWAREDGATEVTLGVAAGNDRAQALYEKCGFVSTGERFALPSDPTREIEIFGRDL
jgi:ribosomal protein S18 acetylase RimI-like enzyme